MPLYLIPLPKTEEEGVVMPWQSIGGKVFDPDDAESLEYLRNLYDSNRQKIRPAPRTLLTPVFALFGVAYPPENPTVRNFRQRWERPFEDILAEATADPSAYMVRSYDPQILRATRYLSAIEDFPWFPIDVLYELDGPDGATQMNEIVMGDDDAENAYFEFGYGKPVEPDTMQSFADIFDRAVARAEPAASDADFARDANALHAAAEWLRFWADRGHPCEAQRLLRSGQGWYRIQIG